MDNNNLIQYCKEHSIRFACRICNRTAPSKENMELVSPSDGIYGSIRYCQLSTIIEENSDIFLCETCCGVLRRCAYGIYHMKYGFVLHGPKGSIRCQFCKSSTIGVKLLFIEEETKKYEVLLLLVEDSVDMPTWICNACNEVLEDLCDLHQTVAYTTLDIQTTSASEKALHAKKRVTLKPVAIPNPKLRLPVFQTSQDFENEEAKNDLPHPCLQDDELMFFMELEDVDTSKNKKSVDIFSTSPKSSIFQAAKDPQTLENKENVKKLFTPCACFIEDDCWFFMEPQELFGSFNRDLNKINQSRWGSSNTSEKQQNLQKNRKMFTIDKNSDRFKTPTWSVLSNESHSDYGNFDDVQKMACSEFNSRSEIYETLYNNTTTFTGHADQGSRTWPWLNNNMWPEMKKVKQSSRSCPITPEIHDLFYGTSQWHNIQGEPLNYSDEGFYNELDINNSENEAFAEKLSSKEADKLNINNDDQAKVLYQAEFSAEKCDENGNEGFLKDMTKPLIQETVKICAKLSNNLLEAVSR